MSFISKNSTEETNRVPKIRTKRKSMLIRSFFSLIIPYFSAAAYTFAKRMKYFSDKWTSCARISVGFKASFAFCAKEQLGERLRCSDTGLSRDFQLSSPVLEH